MLAVKRNWLLPPAKVMRSTIQQQQQRRQQQQPPGWRVKRANRVSEASRKRLTERRTGLWNLRCGPQSATLEVWRKLDEENENWEGKEVRSLFPYLDKRINRNEVGAEQAHATHSSSSPPHLADCDLSQAGKHVFVLERMGDSRGDCPLAVDGVHPPVLLSASQSGTEELRDRSLPSSKDFIRHASFSPDGQLALTLSDFRRMSLFCLNGKLDQYHYYRSTDGGGGEGSTVDQVAPLSLEPVTSFHLAESVSDVAWHPASQYAYPESIGLAVSMRDHPIHILNMHGNVVTSFHPRNLVDELDHSQSLAFHFLGHRLYAGGEKKIRWFDIETRQEQCFATHRKHELFGQRGLISTLAFNPDQSAAFCAGSFDGSVSIYVDGATSSVLDIPPQGFQVSHTLWSPCGRYLYVRGRKHDLVHCWDIRGTKREIGAMLASNNTQQRFTTSLDPWGRLLAAGDDKGFLHLYDTTSLELKSRVRCGASPHSVAFHPYCSLLLVGTGSRSFREVALGEDGDCAEDVTTPSSPLHDADDEEEDILQALREKRRKLDTTESNDLPSLPVVGSQAPRQTPFAAESEVQVWTLPFTPKATPAPLLTTTVEALAAESEEGLVEEPLASGE